MKIILTVFLVFIFASLALIAGSMAVPSCTYRSGSCNGGETCVLSVYQQNDSHIGSCDAYNTKVCCTEITSATVRTNNCNSGEGAVLSMYQTTNSHAGTHTYYSNVVCAKISGDPVLSTVRTSCFARENCLTSLYQQNNTHVGSCGYYSSKICVQGNFNVTVTVILNNTAPNWNESIGVAGVATRSDGSAIDTSSDPADVEVFVNSSRVCTTDTNSSGGYICNFTAPNALGLYSVNVTVDDPTTSLTHWNSTTFNVKASFGSTQSGTSSASSVACYEEPRVVQNPDGTLEIASVRVCVFE